MAEAAPAYTAAEVELSVVIPVYNCAQWVLPKLDAVIAYFSATSCSWELVIVDDGSRDGTAAAVRQYLDGRPFATVHALPANKGKGAAVLEGLRAARGRYRIFMDCDLAYPLTEATKLVAALEKGADVAIANRRLPESICELRTSLISQVHSREKCGEIFNAFVRWLGLTRSRDTQAGLKAVQAGVVPMLNGMTTTRFAFDIELLHIAERHHTRIVEVPVRYRFFENESSIRLLKDGWCMFREVVQIKLQSRNGKYNGRSR